MYIYLYYIYHIYPNAYVHHTATNQRPIIERQVPTSHARARVFPLALAHSRSGFQKRSVLARTK